MPKPSARSGLLVLILFVAAIAAATASSAPTPDFVLSDQHGHDFKLSRERGKPVVLFFGYTHCTDVCPTILANLKRARERTGPKGADTVVALITVDPKRDSEAELGRYVSVFDPSFLGLRGSDAQLNAVYRAYHVRFQKQVESPGDYQISHTAFVYYIGRDGRIAALGLWSDGQPILQRSLAAIANSRR